MHKNNSIFYKTLQILQVTPNRLHKIRDYLFFIDFHSFDSVKIIESSWDDLIFIIIIWNINEIDDYKIKP